jgi:hypothetical protein
MIDPKELAEKLFSDAKSGKLEKIDIAIINKYCREHAPKSMNRHDYEAFILRTVRHVVEMC